MPRDVSVKGRFVCEAISPEVGTFATGSMARGTPGLPRGFTWRGEMFQVAEVLDQWKTTSSCRHGSAEKYVRRHWFDIQDESGRRMTLYFDRQSKNAKRPKDRWFLYEVFQ